MLIGATIATATLLDGPLVRHGVRMGYGNHGQVVDTGEILADADVDADGVDLQSQYD